MAILYIFQAFSWWFPWNCVQGWERRDTGQIPLKMRQSRSRSHSKYWFLQRDVNEKRDCESYRTKMVKPSFEPQPASLMLKMTFLRRSGRKYEKSCSYGHGVSWGLEQNVFWVCKLREIAKNAKKKREKGEWDWVGLIVKLIPEKPLNPRSNRNPPVYCWKWGFWDGSGENMKKVALMDTVFLERSRKMRV